MISWKQVSVSLRVQLTTLEGEGGCKSCGMRLAPHRGVLEYGYRFCNDDCSYAWANTEVW